MVVAEHDVRDLVQPDLVAADHRHLRDQHPPLRGPGQPLRDALGLELAGDVVLFARGDHVLATLCDRARLAHRMIETAATPIQLASSSRPDRAAQTDTSGSSRIRPPGRYYCSDRRESRRSSPRIPVGRRRGDRMFVSKRKRRPPPNWRLRSPRSSDQSVRRYQPNAEQQLSLHPVTHARTRARN